MQAVAAALAFSAGVHVTAAQPAAAAGQRIEIVLERRMRDGFERLRPEVVCERGDLVRFRFHMTFRGYLYVWNRATSGKLVQLYPGSQTRDNNRVESGREYLLPAGGTRWFRLEAPAGDESIYWILSDTPLSGRSARLALPERDRDSLSEEITPRCDDSILRTRGECLEAEGGGSTAGSPLVFLFRLSHR